MKLLASLLLAISSLFASHPAAHSALKLGGTGISLDASTNGGSNGGSGDLTWTHTVSGSNTVLLCAIFDSSGHGDNVTAAYFNGVSMTRLVAEQTGNGFNDYVYIYGLLNPASGGHTVDISQGGADTIYGSCTSFDGVKQSGLPDATAATNGKGNLSTSITTVAANAVVYATTGSTGSAFTASTGLTALITNTSQTTFDSSTFPIVTPGAYSIAANTVSSNAGTALVAVSLAPAPASSTSFASWQMWEF